MLLWLKRIIVTITSPFLKMFRAIKTKFNLNRILIKANQMIVKFIGSILSFRPTSFKDYFDLNGLLVAKKLVYFIILLFCAVPLIYFTRFATHIPSTEAVKAQYEEKTFYYNDIALEGYTGKAVIKYTDETVVYQGDMQEGLCTGYGIVYDLSGKKVYEGELVENKYNGKGKFFNQEGQLIYEGDFVDNLYEGEGTLWNLQVGQRYEGAFIAGQKEGFGTLYKHENNRIIYTGDFLGGLYDGHGTLYNFITGEYYEGGFAHGKKEGEGILYDKNGKPLFTGTYGVNFFEGESRRYLDGKLTYIGTYQDGQKTGEGQEFDDEGNLIYEGSYLNGKRHGMGKLYNSKEGRLIYEGEFVQGEKQGQGKVYDAKGREIYEGQLFNGTLDLSAYLNASWDEIDAHFKAAPNIICSKEATYLVYSEMNTVFVLDSLGIEEEEEKEESLLLKDKVKEAVRKEIKVKGIILLEASMVDEEKLEETEKVAIPKEYEAIATSLVEGKKEVEQRSTLLLMTSEDKNLWQLQSVLEQGSVEKKVYCDGNAYYELVFDNSLGKTVAYSILATIEEG